MKQCWDADPTKRPNIVILFNKIAGIKRSYYPIESSKNKNMMKSLLKSLKLSKSEVNNDLGINKICIETNNTSRLFTSKIYKFDNLPEPKNATEEEQEAFHSKPYRFNIPDNIDDLNSNNENNNSKSKASSIIFKDDSKRLSKVFN